MSESTTETQVQEPQEGDEPTAETPPWGDDFDPARAWEKIQKANREAASLRQRVMTDEQRQKLAEFDRLAEASKTDAERAQEARQAAEKRAEAATQRVARAEVKAALAGLVEDPDSIIEDLNLARFVDEDGEINDDAITALRTKYAAFGGRRAPRPDPSQASGANGRAASSPAADFASFIQGQLGPRS